MCTVSSFTLVIKAGHLGLPNGSGSAAGITLLFLSSSLPSPMFGIEPRASHTLGKLSVTESHLQALPYSFAFYPWGLKRKKRKAEDQEILIKSGTGCISAAAILRDANTNKMAGKVPSLGALV